MDLDPAHILGTLATPAAGTMTVEEPRRVDPVLAWDMETASQELRVGMTR